jgi:membrane-associated phospholipid phosphatase
MRKLLQENKVFFIGFIIVLMTSLGLKSVYGKEYVFLFVNSNHSVLLDRIFPYVTYIGDGITVILFAVILLFFNYRKAIQLGVIYVFSSQITQILKRSIFREVPRPSKYFEGRIDLHYVEGVEIHQMMSFPSGHTTSIFAFMAFLAIITKNKTISIFYLLIACVGGFSRMYLAQHFLEDVIAGSIIGVFTAFIVTVLLNKYDWFHSEKLNGSILKNK